MNPTDPARLATVAGALHLTEEQLTAAAVLCRQVADSLSQPALVDVARRSARGVTREAASSPEGTEQARDLAARLRGLALQLAAQADALQIAAGDAPVDHQTANSVALQLNASEAERARIARDLHDGAAQYFANAVFETEYLRKLITRDPAAAAEGLSQLRESLQQGVREIRQCLFDLRLPAVEELGLVTLLHGYLPEYERQYGLAVDATLPEDELPLAPDHAVAVFRILQEALNNARRHAKATRLTVKLRRRGDEVVLQVDDNGSGFNPEQARPGHYGLSGMRERAQLLDGRLEVQGRPGKGARVILHLPLK